MAPKMCSKQNDFFLPFFPSFVYFFFCNFSGYDPADVRNAPVIISVHAGGEDDIDPPVITVVKKVTCC